MSVWNRHGCIPGKRSKDVEVFSGCFNVGSALLVFTVHSFVIHTDHPPSYTREARPSNTDHGKKTSSIICGEVCSSVSFYEEYGEGNDETEARKCGHR